MAFLFLCSFRPFWEGGQYDGDENKRQDALRLAMHLGASYVDIELEVTSPVWSCVSVFKT